MQKAIDVFNLHKDIIEDYKSFVNSFVNIKNDSIRVYVESEMNRGKFWPEPLIQFNPFFKIGTSVQSLCDEGTLHPDLANIFKGFLDCTPWVSDLNPSLPANAVYDIQEAYDFMRSKIIDPLGRRL